MFLLHQIENHLRHTGTPAARFGREALGDPRFVFDLRAGREPRSGTVKRVLAHIEKEAKAAEHVAATVPKQPPGFCPYRCGVCPALMESAA